MRGPLWCNGSTPAFGAVEYRFESYGRNGRKMRSFSVPVAALMVPGSIVGWQHSEAGLPGTYRARRAST
ncbi:hypothetical protein ARTHRO9V_190158 [Arthrobacter sp. 9V]|nr:hypothetical protein ARTHRO9V_190158 [Arthrobacter sp. 9V]